MGGLIWIIVIVVVISEIKKFQRKNGQRVKPNVPRQQQYMRPDQTKVGQQNVRPIRCRGSSRTCAEPDAAPAAGHAPNQMAGQQNVRPNQMEGRQNVRPNQMPGQRTQSAGGAAMAGCRRPQPNQAENDILKRATENVSENGGDELEQQMMAGAHELVNAIDIDSASELMHEVEDLMIMGYQANLPFERDFIAEGVAMLNGYELDMGA